MWERKKSVHQVWKVQKSSCQEGYKIHLKESSSKKEKIHQAQKGTSASRQERSLESAWKWLELRKTRKAKVPQKFIQSRDERHKKKPARLKTQMGSLGKSEGHKKNYKKK